ncbi:MAG TPA: hypothetical protein VIU81_03465 [Gaiellaceae bacterium]
MASWAAVREQTVWISQLATGFTIVCERCVEEGQVFSSVQATLSLDHARGSIDCPRGHQIAVERDGR